MEAEAITRDNKILSWVKDNWILISIILIALIIRIVFFDMTAMQGQASWWDSAEYLAQGSHYASGLPYEVNPQRPPAFQYMIAGLLSAGANEAIIIFLLVLLPSVLVVYLVYLLSKMLLGKRSGLIAAFITAVSWNFIFWSNRAQPDFLSICFQLLAIIYFWKMIKANKESVIKLAALAGVFSALGFYFKISALLIPLSFGIFIFIKDQFKAFKMKEYWIFLVSYLGALLPYFIWAYVTFGNIFAFSTGYSNAVGSSLPFGWATLTFFNVFGLNYMFYIFLVGMILFLRVFLYLDLMIKNKQTAVDYRLLILIIIGVVLSFYVFYIRFIEDRWVFILLPMMAIICAAVLDKIYLWSKGKDLKWVGIIIVVGLLGGMAYEQVNYGGEIIKLRTDSYIQVKEASQWIKENSASNDIVMSLSYPQTLFYSQRKVVTYSNMDVEEFEKYIEENHPTFLIVSIFEPFAQWVFEWSANTENAIPVKAYYPTEDETNPVLIVYRLN